MDEFRVRVGRITMHDGGADLTVIAPSDDERDVRQEVSQAIDNIDGNITGFSFVAMNFQEETICAYRAPKGTSLIALGDFMRAKRLASAIERLTIETIYSS